MKDPLTNKEKQEFLNRFIKCFYENYEKAFSSGALDDVKFPDHDHTVARAVLIITAHKFEPVGYVGKKTLKNLELFV